MTERQYNQTIWKRTWVPDTGVEITLRVESKRPLGPGQLTDLATVVDACDAFAAGFKPSTTLDTVEALDADE